MSTERPDLLVIGAGIVGVCTALWAQRRGMSVALVDGNAPGSGASYGNAATIAKYGCVPVNSPSLLFDLPRLLTSKTTPLRIDWQYAIRNLPWMLSFLRHCTPGQVRHIANSLGDFLSRTDAGLDPLVEAADAQDMFVQNDFLYAWSSEAGRNAAEASLEVRRQNGVAMTPLASGEIADLEPQLQMPFHSGLRFDGGRHLRDPQLFVTRLFESFTGGGGIFLNANAQSIAHHDNHVEVTLSDATHQSAKQVVIAAGAHARSILGSGAEDLPLGVERGYHVMFDAHADRIGRPFCWSERGFYAVPLDSGLRLAGTVELASLDASPTQKRIDVLRDNGHALFGDIGEPTSTWLGFRPTMPDSLPVIGHSHRSRRILFAFGHQHLGLTLGGITGRVVADLAEGRQPNFDISAFAPERFGKHRQS